MKRRSLTFLLIFCLLLSSAVPAAAEDTLLFDLYTASEKRTFIESFAPEKVSYAGYQADECNALETEDPAEIQALYDALAAIRVTGEYTDGIMVTDSGSSVFFVMEDGTQVQFGFDFGHASVNGKLYTLTGLEHLDQVLWDIENHLDSFLGRNLPEVYSDPAVQDFVQNFDPRNVESALYCYGEETNILITYQEAIRELYNALFDVTIVQKDRGGKPLNEIQSICFLLRDGETVTFSFEWESMLRAEIDGTVYICEWNSTLKGLLEMLRENGGLPKDRLPFPDEFAVSSVETLTIQLEEEEPQVTQERYCIEMFYEFLNAVQVLEEVPGGREEMTPSISLCFTMEEGTELLLRFAEEGETLLLDMNGKGFHCKYSSGSLEEEMRFAIEWIP